MVAQLRTRVRAVRSAGTCRRAPGHDRVPARRFRLALAEPTKLRPGTARPSWRPAQPTANLDRELEMSFTREREPRRPIVNVSLGSTVHSIRDVRP